VIINIHYDFLLYSNLNRKKIPKNNKREITDIYQTKFYYKVKFIMFLPKLMYAIQNGLDGDWLTYRRQNPY